MTRHRGMHALSRVFPRPFVCGGCIVRAFSSVGLATRRGPGPTPAPAAHGRHR